MVNKLAFLASLGIGFQNISTAKGGGIARRHGETGRERGLKLLSSRATFAKMSQIDAYASGL